MLRFLLIYAVTLVSMLAVYYVLFPLMRRRLMHKYLERGPLPSLHRVIHRGETEQPS